MAGPARGRRPPTIRPHVPILLMIAWTFPGTLGSPLTVAASPAHGPCKALDGDSSGQPGDATTTQRLARVWMSGVSGAAAVAGGEAHSLMLGADRTLWATGNDDFGQLGDGTRNQTSTPVQVANLGGMATVAAGYLFSRATAVRQWATTYTYDHLNELVGTSGAAQQTASYAYDPAGNRTSYAQGTTSTAYTYDAADRLTAVGPYTAASDADGNLTGLSGAGVSQAFAYDQANRLTSVTTNGATTTNTYNGDGLRTSQASGGTTTNYLWDVNRSLPAVLSDGTRTYVYGLGLASSVDGSNNVQVYHTDGLGSVRALTDGTGNVVQTYRTDAFGNPISLPGTQGTASQPFGFTGQQQDATGLVYLRARFYAPALGRFMTRDSLVGSPGRPLSLDRYAYVLNAPLLGVDPSGLCSNRVCGLRTEQLVCSAPSSAESGCGVGWGAIRPAVYWVGERLHISLLDMGTGDEEQPRESDSGYGSISEATSGAASDSDASGGTGGGSGTGAFYYVDSGGQGHYIPEPPNYSAHTEVPPTREMPPEEPADPENPMPPPGSSPRAWTVWAAGQLARFIGSLRDSGGG